MIDLAHQLIVEGQTVGEREATADSFAEKGHLIRMNTDPAYKQAHWGNTDADADALIGMLGGPR